MFVWLTYSQTLTAVIAGCEAAWGFFGGVFKVLIPDNLKPVVTDADAVNPRLSRGLAGLRPARRVRHRPGPGPVPEGQAAGGAGRAVRARQLLGRGDVHRPGRRAGPGRGVVPRAGRDADPRHHRAPAGSRCSPSSRPRCCCRCREPYDAADLHPGQGAPRLPRRDRQGVVLGARGSWIGRHLDARADSELVKLYARAAGWSRPTRGSRPVAGPPTRDDLPEHKAGYAMRDLDPADRGLRRARAEHRDLRRAAARRPAALDPDAQRLPAARPGPPLRPRPGRGRLRHGRWTSTSCRCRKIAAMLAKATETAPAGAARRGRLRHNPRRPVRPRPRRVRRPEHASAASSSPSSPAAPTDGSRARGAPADDHHRPRTPGPIDPIGADLIARLKALKLGALSDTLPERLALARQHKTHPRRVPGTRSWPTRSPAASPARRCCAPATAGLDPAMRLDTWDELDDLTYDRDLLADLATLRFIDAGHGVLILGPVGVGKTHLATALGHIAIRRRLHRARRPRRQAVHPAPRRPAGQHPRRRAPQARPRRPADPRRLRPQTPRRHRDQRLLRTRRRTAPPSQHHRHLEPRARRVADHDERRPARPVRRRPAHLRRPHPRHRRPVLPATTPTTGAPP